MAVVGYMLVAALVIGIQCSTIGSETEKLLTCSKYHFEEKVLEKLVRIEHRMDIYDKTLTKWEEQMSLKIEKFEESAKEREIALKSLQNTVLLEQTALNDSYNNILNDLKSQLADFMVNITLEHTNLTTVWNESVNKKIQIMDENDVTRTQTVNSLRHSTMYILNTSISKALNEFSDRNAKRHEEQKQELIAQIKDEIKTPVVLFKARYVQFDANLKGKTLVFTNVMFNRGDGYDATTGIFTASKGGTYLFTVQLCPEPDFYINVRISTNNGDIGMLNTENNFGRDGPCVSADGVSVLAEGDKVWITCYSVSSSGDALHNPSPSINGNNFSGVLIHTSAT